MTIMAMSTTLQMVSAEEIAKLKKTPASINKLNQPGKKSYASYYACTINFFLCGDAYPSGKNPLASALFGAESVETATLENGSFSVVQPKMVPLIAKKLAAVDLAKVRKQFKKADAEEMEEAEALDFEILMEAENPEKELIVDIEKLQKFYASAAKQNLGVVTYTT